MSIDESTASAPLAWRDLNEMGAAELVQELAALRPRRDQVAAERDDIQRQRFCAMNQAKVEGRYSDRTWFARSGSALAFKTQAVSQLNRRIQAIEARLGQFERLRNEERQRERDRMFIDVAREVLSREVFSQIWQEARRR